MMGNNMQGLRGNSPGPKGEPGIKGDQGPRGESGTYGQKGDRGDPGLFGAKGERVFLFFIFLKSEPTLNFCHTNYVLLVPFCIFYHF